MVTFRILLVVVLTNWSGRYESIMLTPIRKPTLTRGLYACHMHKAVFYGDLNQEDLEVFLFRIQIEKSMFYGQLNQEDSVRNVSTR